MSADLFARLREGHAECPSDFALDRWVAGELGGKSRHALDLHVEGCTLCAERVRTRRAGFAGHPNLDARRILARLEGAAELPAPSFTERVRAWLSGWSLAFTTSAVAVVAIGLVVLNQRGPEPVQDRAAASGVRLKGGVALRVYRLRGGHSEPVLSGAGFAPGDRLRFEIDTPVEGFVSIVGVEPDGSLYQAWPLDVGQTARQLGASQRRLLEGAASLDDTRGREVLYLVHCPLLTGKPQCTAHGPTEPPQCQSSCVLSPFSLDKRP